MGPRSLLLLEGEEHLERRRVMLPPFHGERMRGYEAAMAEIARAEVERWPVGSELALQPRMRAITGRGNAASRARPALVSAS